MERVSGFSRILATGAPAPSCTVTVYDTGTVNLSTVYSDDLAAPTPKANPFLADASGFWFFYASGAKRYDVVLSGGGIVAPYTLADLPAGLGDGTVPAYTAGTLPATSAPHAGRLARQTDGRRGLLVDDGAAWNSVLDYGLDSKTLAGLPVAGVAGRIRRVTNTAQGVYIDDGSDWVPLLAYALQSHNHAALPAAALAGRLRRQNDGARGVWMDTGAAWLGLSGEVANVVEFGAVRDGATDDLAAIQAAIDALATSGGVVYFPPGSYAISAPIRVRDGVTLRGTGRLTAIVDAAGWAGDSFIQAYRRDDNVLANVDIIGVAELGFSHSAEPAAFSAIDLTGTHAARVTNVQVTLTPSVAGTDALLRLADQNPAGTSTKYCRYAIISGLHGTASRFLTFAQSVSGQTSNNVILGFRGYGHTTGISFAGVAAGRANLSLVAGMIAGDGVAGSVAYDVGAVSLPGRLWLVGATFTGFDSSLDFIDETFFSSTPGYGTSGTTAASPLAAGGTLAQTFHGSCYVSVPSGTALVAGVNTVVVVLPGLATGACVHAIPVSGLPATPVSLQAASVATTLTLTIVAAAAVTLSSDFIVRLVRVGP